MKLKPYEKYKDSCVEWIGEIPEDWDIHRFKINFDTIKGRVPNNLQNEYKVGMFPYLSMEFLRGINENVEYSYNPKAIKVSDNDLLLLWDGSNAGEFVNGKEGYLSSTMVKLIVNSLNFSYSNYLCKAFESLLKDLTVGMGIPHVNGDILYNIQIPIPGNHEQNQIANFLDKKTLIIDKAIEKNRKLIELLEEKRKSLINNVVTKGINPNAKMKDSGVEWIGEIPEISEVVPFRRICTLSQGLQFPQSERLEKYSPNSKIYITIKYIHSKEKIKEYIPNPPLRVVFHKDDILMARTGATGEVVTNQEGVFHNNFFKINYNKSLLEKKYLVYYLKMDSIKENLVHKAGSTTIPDLNHDSFLDTSFIFHPIDIQKDISNYLDSKIYKNQSIIDNVFSRINFLEEYKKSLIHQIVTGKYFV